MARVNQNFFFMAVLSFLLLPMLTACDSTSVPPASDCERLNQGTLKFTNESNHTRYKVLLNSSVIGYIDPAETISRTVSSGTNQTFEFRFAANNQKACNSATTNVATCYEDTYSCDRDL